MKRRILLSLAALFGCVFMLAAGSAKASAYGYDIESYDVNIQVADTNELTITEKIHANFNNEKHGIYRKIPLRNEIKRNDGSSAVVLAKISDVTCNEPSSSSLFGGEYELKIGDEDETITGPKDYIISYKYDLGNDTLDNADELYYNIIGTGWSDTSISNVTFTINMPKDFDESKLGMSCGKEGTDKGQKRLYYKVNGRTITGGTNKGETLGPNNGITIRLTLPDQYFVVEKEGLPWTMIVGIFLSVLGILLAIALWYLYGRDDPVIDVVEFYAPDGLNSAQIGYLYKGEATKEDAVSLMVYLASKGYLTIIEEKKSFKLKRGKPYDGNQPEEAMFLKGLFKDGNTVTKKSLQNTFYKTINSITSHIGRKENKYKVFEQSSLNKGWMLYIVVAAIFICLSASAFPWMSELSVFSAGLSLIPAAILAVGVGIWAHKGQGVISRIIVSVVCAIGIVIAYYILLADYQFGIQKVCYAAGFACSIAILIMKNLLSKRTQYGTEMLGRINGFKQFIHNAEKDKLEALVKEDPTYFYDIMPYAYVLGESDRWIKQFESITLDPPTWYMGSDPVFNYVMFSHFMRDTMSSASSAMTSAPSSSGGGSVGGGSGGGGGGSW